MRDLRISGHVGFDSLPDQLVTKCVNKGFDFNILCIGTYTSTTISPCKLYCTCIKLSALEVSLDHFLKFVQHTFVCK